MIKLNSISRKSLGKAASRKSRKGGLVPAVIYSKEGENKTVLVSASYLSKLTSEDKSLMTRVFEVSVFENIDESNIVDFKAEIKEKPVYKIQAIIKEIQADPMTYRAQSIDFKEVEKNEVVSVEVPVKFINREKCDVLKFGGFLHVLNFNPKVKVGISSIPEYLEYDLSSCKAGQIIRFEDFTLPKGVSMFKNCDIAKVTGKKGA